MKNLIKKIRDSGKNHLAAALESGVDKSILEYSKTLLSHSPENNIESELMESFKEEMVSRGFSEQLTNRTIQQLKSNRVIQTSPHTSLVPSSRMFCIDWLSTQALQAGDLYIVGSFSGIPFSNSVKPGRINTGTKSLNFVPKTHQDALVYKSPVFEKSFAEFDLNMKSLQGVVSPAGFESFSDWACSNSGALHSRALDKEIVYLDINNVIARYILKVIDNQAHPISKLLFDNRYRETFIKHFGEKTHLFYGAYKSSKYKKRESLYFDGLDLSGDYHQIRLSPEELRKKLIDGTLCPATILTFTILSFLNDFKCLGSFMQVEYLSEFKNKWQASGLLGDVSLVKTSNLSTGEFENFTETSLEYLSIKPDLLEAENSSMKYLWLPMKDQFLK
ncbi:MAG: hypothetical protein ACI88L_000218 [Candidatus Paceibacteria bacterium]